VSSGFGLSMERAMLLKENGLTGISISIDHFDKDKHNKFRGNTQSFDRAVQAARYGKKAGLAVVLSLCATRAFVTRENMYAYASFAKDLGASFILVLEPRSVGHYANMDVALTGDQEILLEEFFLALNYDSIYSKYPAVSYHGYHQRRAGCFGSGNRYLYVDTNGNFHVCPFCRNKKEISIGGHLNKTISQLKQTGCQPFTEAII
jgi:MoaA/NifB/PqqE/SkfB family radical SAM enzyme